MWQKMRQIGSGGGSEEESGIDITKYKAVKWLQKDTTASQNFTIPSGVKLIVVMGGFGINAYNGEDSRVGNTGTLYLTEVGQALSQPNGKNTGVTDYATWTAETTLNLKRTSNDGTMIVVCFAEI